MPIKPESSIFPRIRFQIARAGRQFLTCLQVKTIVVQRTNDFAQVIYWSLERCTAVYESWTAKTVIMDFIKAKCVARCWANKLGLIVLNPVAVPLVLRKIPKYSILLRRWCFSQRLQTCWYAEKFLLLPQARFIASVSTPMVSTSLQTKIDKQA